MELAGLDLFVVLWFPGEDGTDVDFVGPALLDFLGHLGLVLEAEVSAVDVVLEREGELAVLEVVFLVVAVVQPLEVGSFWG